jgi:hypothetical protein
MRLRVFIGYDGREHEAWRVCAASLVRRTSIDLEVTKLDDHQLRAQGLFWRKWRRDGQVMVDELDGRPFSTAFAFTRFLVPALCRADDYRGWALFVDCDMLWTADIAGLLPLLDPGKALMCVQHQQTIAADGGTKMDGQPQQAYPRKNWSSFMAFNMADPVHDALSAPSVNLEEGRWLHGLSWLKDEQIGGLPETWNWLEGYSSPRAPDDPPAVVHFTRGGPWFAGWQDVAFAERWREERRALETDQTLGGAVATLLAGEDVAAE